MKKEARAWIAFNEAIEKLGGRVSPMMVHDDPIEVIVPHRHRIEAKRLLDELNATLDNAPVKLTIT